MNKARQIALFALLFLLAPVAANAATLFLIPASATVQVGSTITVSVVVNTAGAAINDANGTLAFPSGMFDLVSISQSSSVFTLWEQNPTYDGSTGISFDGGLPTPGYLGASGDVFTVTLRAIAAGSASLSLQNAAVLANDGLGTDVLTATPGSTITVTEPPAPAPVAPAPVQTAAPAPAAPVAVSAKPAVISQAVTSSTSTIATSTALQAPIVTSFTQDVALDGSAQILGSSIYPGASVYLTLQPESGSPIGMNGIVAQNGVFTFTQADDIAPGDYTGQVYVEQDGAQSPPSASFVIRFNGESLFQRSIAVLYQPGVAIAFALILAFMLGMLCARLLFGLPRRDTSVRAILRAVDSDIHKAFLALRREINESIDEMRQEGMQRKLTSAEMRFIQKMTSSIKDTERLVEQDVRAEGD